MTHLRQTAILQYSVELLVHNSTHIVLHLINTHCRINYSSKPLPRVVYRSTVLFS